MSYLIKCANPYSRYMYRAAEGERPSWRQNACEATLFENYDEALELANKSKLSDISILEIRTKYVKDTTQRKGEALNEAEQAIWTDLKGTITTRSDLISFILMQAKIAGLNLYDRHVYEDRWKYDTSNVKPIKLLGEEGTVECNSHYGGISVDISDIIFNIELPNAFISSYDDKIDKKLKQLCPIFSSITYANYWHDNQLCAYYTVEDSFSFIRDLLGIEMNKLCVKGVRRGDKEAVKYINDVVENNTRNINRLQTKFDIWYNMIIEKVKPELERAIEYMNGGKD